MQRIIVTADDYGMCNEVDRAIDAGIENGFITTTNVMLNMKTLSDAADLRTRYPSLSAGIHWNVTTGKQISDPKTISSPVDENGAFWPIGTFKKKYHKGEIFSADLEKALEAQYSLFEKVALKHEIPATRTFQRVYYDKFDLGFKRELIEFAVKIFLSCGLKKSAGPSRCRQHGKPALTKSVKPKETCF